MEYTTSSAARTKEEIVRSFGKGYNRQLTRWSLNRYTKLLFLDNGLNGWVNVFSENSITMTNEGKIPQNQKNDLTDNYLRIIFRKNDNGKYNFIGVFRFQRQESNSFIYEKINDSVKTEDYTASLGDGPASPRA